MRQIGQNGQFRAKRDGGGGGNTGWARAKGGLSTKTKRIKGIYKVRGFYDYSVDNLHQTTASHKNTWPAAGVPGVWDAPPLGKTADWAQVPAIRGQSRNSGYVWKVILGGGRNHLMYFTHHDCNDAPPESEGTEMELAGHARETCTWHAQRNGR